MLDLSDDDADDSFVRRRNTHPSSQKSTPSFILVKPSSSEPKSSNDDQSLTLSRGSTDMLLRDTLHLTETFHSHGRNPLLGPTIFTGELAHSELKKYELKSQLINSQRSTANMFSLNPKLADDPDSFFASLKPMVIVAQIFSLMPVTGVTGPNYRSLMFKWLDWRVLYTAVTFIGNVFLFFCSLSMNFKFGFSYDRTAPLVFFSSVALANVLMVQLARNWAEINQEFADLEFKMSKYGYPKRIAFKFKIITAIFVAVALVEHLLAKCTDYVRILPCSKLKGDALSVMEAFFINNYYQVFSLVSYAPWKGVLVLMANVFATLIWNYTDLFLALISWYISEKFKQVNAALFAIEGQDKPSYFWRSIREDYNELSMMTRRIDSHIQRLMLLSMGDNLFFICQQLLKSLKKRVNIFQSLYFFWSFGFLIVRMCFVGFCAACINDEAKEAKTVLYSVPHNSFCSETRRFLTQLTTNEIALTGCRFFSVTRGLLLTIAGTVVTYEIVLVQFNIDAGTESWPTEGNKTFCAML